ncbi:MAG: hypothetical protein ACEQSE_04555 [Candidatus Aquirickettsiella gammari]
MKTLASAFSIGVGTAIGILLYSRFLSASHEFDWHRAIFVGVFCGVGAAIWPRKLKK